MDVSNKQRISDSLAVYKKSQINCQIFVKWSVLGENYTPEVN